MDMNINKLLAPRIEKHCLSLYESGQHKHAAREAMVQVELALKEKGRLGSESYGVRLIERIFKGHQGVILKVPLGDNLQEKAQKYFEGVFSYYRNYVAHDGAHIDERSSLRILFIASELLEMLQASSLTLADRGGIKGIVRIVDCGSQQKLVDLLRLLDGYCMPELTYDGLFETVYMSGFSDNQFESIMEIGLIKMTYSQAEDPVTGEIENMERLVLTELGHEILETSNTSLEADR